jgi:hypothetical protein
VQPVDYQGLAPIYDREIDFVIIRKCLIFNDLRWAAGRAVVSR